MSEGCTDLRNCVVSSGEAGDPAAGENAVTIRWSWSKLMRDKSIPSAHANELDQAKRAAELQQVKSVPSKRRDYRPCASFHPERSTRAEAELRVAVVSLAASTS